ncbi:MAG: hypothetical protein UFJ02_03345 [Prevotella sp.]|nr:hypothetical protein [Prevotella sp.]
MTKLIKTTDLPSTLDALELMEVRGGERQDNDPSKTVCFLLGRGVIKCPVAGSGECSVEGSGIIVCTVAGSGNLKKEE